MDSFQTDWLIVVIAALLNMAIRCVWYSKWYFGPVWQKLSEVKKEDLNVEEVKKEGLNIEEVKKEDSNVKKGPLLGIYEFITSFIIAYFISFFEGYLGITDVTDGMFLAFLIWLGFVATTQISPVIWCKRPLKLFAIDSGYKLVSFLVMGGIIGA